MTNNLQIFENAEFGQLRTVEINGEIYFVATDVCKILDLSNPTVAVSKLDDDEKAKFNLGYSGSPGNPNVTCVNESGLYRLVFASRKPDAKKFQCWVYHEILPAIRKTGAYFTEPTAEEILNNPEKLLQIFTNFAEERRQRIAAEKTIAEQKPKVLITPKVTGKGQIYFVGKLIKKFYKND